ncbi:MAG: accessory factor UbiK family protein [Betaproteobacteria bacterium]|nr:accessory factor UbiK family protein [Betaproteobacteria bacterium]
MAEENERQTTANFPDLDECLKGFKANAAALLERCDLVTRREFEVQKRLLEQAMTKLAAVEAKLAESGAGSDSNKSDQSD